eukprot:7628589-Lingulodinium_polyedra.AAC.1
MISLRATILYTRKNEVITAPNDGRNVGRSLRTPMARANARPDLAAGTSINAGTSGQGVAKRSI